MVRKALRLRPVHSRKVERTWSNLASDASTSVAVVLAEGTKGGGTGDDDVAIGATISWIFVEFNVSAETTTNPKVVHWFLAKKPAGTALGAPNVYNTDFRRFVIKRGMEMLPKDQGTVYKRVFAVKVPRQLARIGEGDQIVFQYICSSAETINCCGITIHKVFE